jgi:hypothetical protein
MATQAQITANQANALLSTGPTSAEGKARVAQNAIKHGLTAKNLTVPDDLREEFEALREDFLAQFNPQRAAEMTTFNDLLHAAWNLHRYRQFEAEASVGTLEDFNNPEKFAALERITRYHSRIQRAYYRALKELRQLQTDRALRICLMCDEDKEALPQVMDVAKWQKQTRHLGHSDPLGEALARDMEKFNQQMAVVEAQVREEYAKSQKLSHK